MVNILRKNKKLIIQVSVTCLVLIITVFSISYIKKRNTENRIISQLPNATAQQVLEYYFWGINNHSGKVVKACSYYKDRNFDYNYSDVKQWVTLDIKKVEPDTSYHFYKDGSAQYIQNFRVRFKLKKKFFIIDSSMKSGIYNMNKREEVNG